MKMNKEYLEALKRLKENSYYVDDKNMQEDVNILNQALQRLEQIDNANPSEALECWQWINATIPQWVREKDKEHPNVLEPIKQALIKAQEQEKALKIIFEKEVDIEYIKKETTLEDYNKWIEFIDSIGINIPKNENRQLTREEFDLLKRWLENEITRVKD